MVDLTHDEYTDYLYRVVAQNTVGYLDAEPLLPGSVGFPDLTVQSVSLMVTVLNPPKAPSNLSATLAFGPVVTLNWTDNATTETGFVIERAQNGGAFAQIGTVGANITTYVDTTVPTIQQGATFRYQVKAVNAIGSSLYSNTAQVVVPAPPNAPTLLSATLQQGPQINVTWRDNSNNETGFIVERFDGLNWTQIGTAPQHNGNGNMTFLDTTALPGSTYTYRVAARNLFVKAYSNTLSVSIPALPATPTIATIIAVRQGNNERVTVTWNNVTGETGYTIQWNTTGIFPPVSGSGSVGANVTTFTTGTIARQTWYFRVGAFNTAGTVWSAVVPVAAAP